MPAQRSTVQCLRERQQDPGDSARQGRCEDGPFLAAHTALSHHRCQVRHTEPLGIRRMHVRRKRPHHSAVQADGEVLQENPLPCCRFVQLYARYPQQRRLCLITKLVSERLGSLKSNRSMTCPGPYVLNTDPRPPNCMPLPGPHSRQQRIRQRWTA